MTRKKQLCPDCWAQPELVRIPRRGGGFEGKYLGVLYLFSEADPTPHTCRASCKLSVPGLISDMAILTGNIANDESSLLPECHLQSPVCNWMPLTILGKSWWSTL